MVVTAVVRYVLVTLSYARRDLVLPAVRGRRGSPTTVLRRSRSLVAFFRLLPAVLPSRWRIRRRATVGDDALLGWMVQQ